MPTELRVHINRDGLHSLEVPTSFAARGSFDVRLINHGESVHVHLHLEELLAEAGAIDATNHYVKGDSERVVPVAVADGARGLGKLKVATSYGAQTRYIDVEVDEPEEPERSVAVDESLASPKPEPEPEGGVVENARVAVLGLAAAAALVIAAGAVVLIEEPTVLVAALIVLAAVVGATYVVLTGE